MRRSRPPQSCVGLKLPTCPRWRPSYHYRIITSVKKIDHIYMYFTEAWLWSKTHGTHSEQHSLWRVVIVFSHSGHFLEKFCILLFSSFLLSLLPSFLPSSYSLPLLLPSQNNFSLLFSMLQVMSKFSAISRRVFFLTNTTFVLFVPSTYILVGTNVMTVSPHWQINDFSFPCKYHIYLIFQCFLNYSTSHPSRS